MNRTGSEQHEMKEIFKDDNYIVVHNEKTGNYSYGLRKYMRNDFDFVSNHAEQTAQTVISQIRYRQDHSKKFWNEQIGTVPRHISEVWDSEDKIISLLTTTA